MGDQFPNRIELLMGKGLVWAVYITKPHSSNLDANFTDQLVEKSYAERCLPIRTDAVQLS